MKELGGCPLLLIHACVTSSGHFYARSREAPQRDYEPIQNLLHFNIVCISPYHIQDVLLLWQRMLFIHLCSKVLDIIPRFNPRRLPLSLRPHCSLTEVENPQQFTARLSPSR